MRFQGKPYTNRLAQQKSPYLLQHAHNPVDWCPWGEEAFEKARADNRPIFLSIGYATCHWLPRDGAPGRGPRPGAVGRHEFIAPSVILNSEQY